MNRIALKQITRVYRFGMNLNTWTRDRAVEDHFIAYKLSGCTIHERDGETFPFRKDMLMVANQNDLYRVTQHEFSAEGRKGGCIAAHFTTSEPFDLHLSVYNCAGHPQVKSAFFKMLDAWNQFQSGHPAAEYACVSRFYEICYYLSEIQSGDTTAEDGRIDKARAFLERNLADSTLTIADAADTAHLSQRRFTELFTERFGETPGRFLTDCRMKRAAELLHQPQLTVAEISTLSGYADSSYFIRVFRKAVGTSPNAYRNQFK